MLFFYIAYLKSRHNTKNNLFMHEQPVIFGNNKLNMIWKNIKIQLLKEYIREDTQSVLSYP